MVKTKDNLDDIDGTGIPGGFLVLIVFTLFFYFDGDYLLDYNFESEVLDFEKTKLSTGLTSDFKDLCLIKTSPKKF